jgi:hypothetical protein
MQWSLYAATTNPTFRVYTGLNLLSWALVASLSVLDIP